MDYQFLLLAIEGGVATVTINRPKALNALNAVVLQELTDVFTALAKDESLRAVILTGAGGKAFVAGADIASMADLSPLQAREFGVLGQNLMQMIEDFPRPVIAAIDGFALGGGCELAMSCDIRLASESAKFGQPEVNLGVIPGFAGTQRLPRLVGKGIAKELLYTGDIINAAEALRIGLVNKVVENGKLLEAAQEMASKIAKKGPLAVQLCKVAVNNGLEMDVEKGCAYEADLFALCFASEDQSEGMKAFLEKRAAQFKGC